MKGGRRDRESTGCDPRPERPAPPGSGKPDARPLGTVPARGVLTFPVAFPGTFPRMRIPTQALIEGQLTNLDVVHVI